jgi:HEAT repeat protein
MIQKNAKDIFNEIIELTEKTTELMGTFQDCDTAEQEAILSDNFSREIEHLGEKDDISIRLLRTTEMLVNVGTPGVVTLLAKGLDNDNLDVRMLSGDALMHLAEEGLETIMPAVETVLEKGGVGAEEMPFILAEVDDAEVPRQLDRFLGSANPAVVAAALEAVVECGDDESVAVIEKLVNDPREVSVDEDPNSGDKTTIGHLAKDALDLLSDSE